MIRAYYSAQARPIAPKRGESIEQALERSHDARLDIPLKAGESFEDGLARVAPLIRDSLGIAPAPEVDPLRWAEMKRMAEPR